MFTTEQLWLPLNPS